MEPRPRLRPTYAGVAATLALVVSLAGGAYALRISGDDVVNDSLTGKDVKERTLKAVPNAKELGGLGAKGFTRKCGPGTLVAGAWIFGADGGYDLSTYGTAFTEAKGHFFGCKPISEVLIKRNSAGSYVVVIKPDRTNTLFAVGNVDNTYGNFDDAFISVGTALNTSEGEGHSVEIRNHAGTAVDTPFNIYLY